MGRAGGRNRIYAGRVVGKIGREGRFQYVVALDVSGKLIDNC